MRGTGKPRSQDPPPLDWPRIPRRPHSGGHLQDDSPVQTGPALASNVPTRTSRQPTPARVRNCSLGGKDDYQPEQTVGDVGANIYPRSRTTEIQSRQYLNRSVRHLTEEAGIRQFLDLGSGLPDPRGNNTHTVDQAAAPDANLVYVHTDPVVTANAREPMKSGQLRVAPIASSRARVFAGVVPAEQQLAAGRQGGPDAGCGAAAVAPVEAGQCSGSAGGRRGCGLRRGVVHRAHAAASRACPDFGEPRAADTGGDQAGGGEPGAGKLVGKARARPRPGWRR